MQRLWHQVAPCSSPLQQLRLLGAVGGEQLGRRAATRLILEIDIGGVEHCDAGRLIVDRPEWPSSVDDEGFAMKAKRERSRAKCCKGSSRYGNRARYYSPASAAIVSMTAIFGSRFDGRPYRSFKYSGLLYESQAFP
jgi:hypothetical protein